MHKVDQRKYADMLIALIERYVTAYEKSVEHEIGRDDVIDLSCDNE